MLRNTWGKRSYVDALAGGARVPDPGGGSTGVYAGSGGDLSGGVRPRQGGEARDANSDPAAQRSQMQQAAVRQGRDLVREAANKKFFFQQKLFLEGKRKGLGKGNIVTFLMGDARAGIETSDVSKILRVGGFKPEQIVTIKLNDFRANQVEVLFKPEVDIDAQGVEEKLRRQQLNVNVSKFEHIEEFLMIYGLPPTFDVGNLKMKVNEAITPFVKKVLEVTPCVHTGSVKDDFFDGKYNGNWLVKIVPKNKVQVPNFIVVGNDAEVQAKAVYTKKITEKEEMCSDCYRVGHYKRDCPGPRPWTEYCQEFRKDWEAYAMDDTDEEHVAPTGEEESRLFVLNKALSKEVDRVEKEKVELETAKALFENRVKELQSELEVAQDASRMMDQREVGQLTEERDIKIKELEAEAKANRKIIESLNHNAEENAILKLKLEKVRKDMAALEDKCKEDDERVTQSHRRLSKSFAANADDFDLNEAGVGSMFTENEGDDELSPPHHGFPEESRNNSETQAKNISLVVKQIEKGTTQGTSVIKETFSDPDPSPQLPPQPQRPGVRGRSSPGDSNKSRKKSNRHPEAGDEVIIETDKGAVEFKVIEKVSNQESDSLFRVSQIKDGKSATLNFKRIKWNVKSPQDLNM